MLVGVVYQMGDTDSGTRAEMSVRLLYPLGVFGSHRLKMKEGL